MSEFGLRSYEEDPVDPKLPEQLLAIHTGDWINLIFRMKIPTNCYGVAIALARFASTDGTNVFPGAKKIADMAKMDEKTARGHIKALLELGMLALKKRGGGRAGNPSVYRLTRPADITTLPLWLDPEMNRIPAGAEFSPAESSASNAYSPAFTPGESVFEDQEHRASAPVETAEHRAHTPAESPVDNSAAAETPGDPGRNTGRSAPKHRAPTPDDLTITRPLKDLPGSSQATNSLGWRERPAEPGAFAALVGPPTLGPWISLLPPAAAATHADHAAPPTGPRTYAPDPPPPRIVHGTAVAAPTAEAAAAFAVLAALPGEGEWWRHAAARELRRDGHPDPSAQDLAIRAAAILRRTDLEKTA